MTPLKLGREWQDCLKYQRAIAVKVCGVLEAVLVSQFTE